jgi:hypothetical protein
MFKPLKKSDPRFKGWLVREQPEGHYRHYTYLYWREKGRLRKQYVPLREVSQVRKAFRLERQRMKRQRSRQMQEELWQRLFSKTSFCAGYIKLFLRYAIVDSSQEEVAASGCGNRSTKSRKYRYKPGYSEALRLLMYRSLRLGRHRI